MSHEPECPPWVVITRNQADCICDRLRAAYKRGKTDAIECARGAYIEEEPGRLQRTAWNAGVRTAVEYIQESELYGDAHV